MISPHTTTEKKQQHDVIIEEDVEESMTDMANSSRNATALVSKILETN